MIALYPTDSISRRVDLHCHSEASDKAAEVLLSAIRCPECYSLPAEVYRQAKLRGMDFVTITDHDTIDGVCSLLTGHDDVLVGEELTCFFPEDRCKIHLLVYGIAPQQHAELQNLAADIYQVAQYLEQQNIAHGVAHPIYRQNDKLRRWHLERLLLLFKGFECLNGSHSALHREAFEPLLDSLSRNGLMRLAEEHGIQPRWSEPWIKARLGGSDDHALLNVGRTWTEFPPDTKTVADVLQCLRDGTCKPGGQAGSSIKLAHAFYGIAVRYYGRHILPAGVEPNLPTQMLQAMVGQRPAPSTASVLREIMNGAFTRLRNGVAGIFGRRHSDGESGTAVLRRIFAASLQKRLREFPALRQAAAKGLPPLGEHEEVHRFVSALNRDVAAEIAKAIEKSIADASFTELFDLIGAVVAHQFVLLPYYFSMFHQNRERHLLRSLTGSDRIRAGRAMRVALFTDTLDEVNGVSRFIRDMARQAEIGGYSLTVHTCVDEQGGGNGAGNAAVPGRKNFQPLLSRPMPYYQELRLNLPPLLDIMEWADRQQFDAVHISTPGPMGLCGWVVAKMLRVPILATYHTDFPAYIEHFTGDHRAAGITRAYMLWLYGQAATVYTRSRSYITPLRDMGICPDLLVTLPAGVDLAKFSPRHREAALWNRLGVSQPHRLFYCGRVSVEKNLPLLAQAFKQLCARRRDTALVIAGDGPYLATMRDELQGLPVYFLGYQKDDTLTPLYASSDLLVFPSRTDTLGQVVLEAQASGLPAIVSDEGGPHEIVIDGQSGLCLAATDPAVWCDAIDALLNDEPRRQRFAATAIEHVQRWSLEKMFEAFWASHVTAEEPEEDEVREIIERAAVGV